jgi:hypothetical protein
MAFKLTNKPYDVNNTPIYQRDMEEGVMGEANKNGSIIINKNAPAQMKQEIIAHEMVHIDQIKRGDLDYDNQNVYWKGKKIPRSSIKEGDKGLPWEVEAWKVNKKFR